MVDLYLDEHTGRIEGCEVSGGLFAGAYSGRSFVPALQTLKIDRDVAFVPAETAQFMAENVGGSQAAMHTVGGKFQETAQETGEHGGSRHGKDSEILQFSPSHVTSPFPLT